MENLQATYGRGSADSSEKLLIEQQEWKPFVGGLSTFAMVSYIASLIFGSDYDVDYDCGIVDGRYVTPIYVYPLVENLHYAARATRGDLADRREVKVDMTESIQLKLTTSSKLKYPVAELVSLTWKGDCFDTNLVRVPPPGLRLSADKKSVISDRAVYGTIIPKYKVLRHVYLLSVYADTEAVENEWSSVFFCRYSGRWPQHCVIQPPPGAEEFDGSCAQGGGGSVTIEGPDPDDGDPPGSPHADRTTKYDWCDKYLISDSIVGV